MTDITSQKVTYHVPVDGIHDYHFSIYRYVQEGDQYPLMRIQFHTGESAGGKADMAMFNYLRYSIYENIFGLPVEHKSLTDMTEVLRMINNASKTETLIDEDTRLLNPEIYEYISNIFQVVEDTTEYVDSVESDDDDDDDDEGQGDYDDTEEDTEED